MTLDGGTLQYMGTGDTTSRGPWTTASTVIQVSNSGTDLTLNGSVSGRHGLAFTKTGSGTLTLSGNVATTTGFTPTCCKERSFFPKFQSLQVVSNLASVSPGALVHMGSNTTGNNAVYFAAGHGINNMNGTFDFNGQSEGSTTLSGTRHIDQQQQHCYTTSLLTFGVTPNGSPWNIYLVRRDCRRHWDHGPVREQYQQQHSTLTLTGTSNTYSGGTTIGNSSILYRQRRTSPGSLPGNVVISSSDGQRLDLQHAFGHEHHCQRKH